MPKMVLRGVREPCNKKYIVFSLRQPFRNLTVTLHFPADNLPWHEEFALKIEKVKETSSFCQTLEVYLYQMICRLEGKRIVIFMGLMY